MKRINVQTSNAYDVVIGSGLLFELSQQISNIVQSEKIVVVSDSNVWPLYGELVMQQLLRAGFCVNRFVFPAGEDSKNGATYLQLLNYLAEEKISRSDALIALGGGVVGDLTGFVAATYLRGIQYIQIPTTLLAAVDSSVGGKTAIDLPAGKNLAGAFYQPALVICDTNTLSTLPKDVFCTGCAEVIKYGMLYDAALFSHLEQFGLDFQQESVIAKCVQCKCIAVQQDEFDRGARQMLNLGHTFGHSIEAISHYQISHGEAVAIGMAMITRAAVAYGFCDQVTKDRLITLLEQFQLPIKTSFNPDDIFNAALADKKRSGRTVNLIIPEQIGHCKIHTIPTENMKSFIKAGM